GRWRCDRSCKLELHAHMNATTLTALMEANRGAARSVTYLEGERDARPVAYGALHERALGILYRLQGLGARPGDKLILLLSHNEPFIDAEQRLLERIGSFAAAHEESELYGSLRTRAFLVDELDSIGRSGKPYQARPEDV